MGIIMHISTITKTVLKKGWDDSPLDSIFTTNYRKLGRSLDLSFPNYKTSPLITFMILSISLITGAAG